MRDIKAELASVAEELRDTYEGRYRYFHEHTYMVPDRKEIIRIVKLSQSVMFPSYFKVEPFATASEEERLNQLFLMLKRQITASFAFLDSRSVVDTEEYAINFIRALPCVKEMLIKDIQAIFEGDPAARSPEEVILCYPGFYAISVYRIAHWFYSAGVPYIGRIMTEFAHEKTGIDIHAGATIGEYFFIDHGTGIVIGETTVIGDRVKIYQGVTLGAKSFELSEDGKPIKGIKRHPDIGDDCIIYANATILGGNTKVGQGSVIGANVWITSSVPAGTTVYYGRNN